MAPGTAEYGWAGRTISSWSQTPTGTGSGADGRRTTSTRLAERPLVNADLMGQEPDDGQPPAVLAQVGAPGTGRPGRGAGVRHGDPQYSGVQSQTNGHLAAAVLSGVRGEFGDDEFRGFPVVGGEPPLGQDRPDAVAHHRHPRYLGGQRQDGPATGGGAPGAAGNRGRLCLLTEVGRMGKRVGLPGGTWPGEPRWTSASVQGDRRRSREGWKYS